jgi:hypothetical protein
MVNLSVLGRTLDASGVHRDTQARLSSRLSMVCVCVLVFSSSHTAPSYCYLFRCSDVSIAINCCISFFFFLLRAVVTTAIILDCFFFFFVLSSWFIVWFDFLFLFFSFGFPSISHSILFTTDNVSHLISHLISPVHRCSQLT